MTVPISLLRKNLLLGLGNPLLDIIANADNTILEKYSLNPNDAILAEEKHLPLYKELVDNYKVEFIGGGSCQNSMRAVQWVLKTPEITSFMGCIGCDDYGKILESKAREVGVDVHYQYNSTVPTGTCAVVVTKNGTNRSLCANLGAANTFKINHIKEPKNKLIIEQAQYFYLTGFFITVSPDSIIEVAKHAAANDKFLAMNISAPFICQYFFQHLSEALPYVDLLFGNETEALAYSEAKGLNTKDFKEIAKSISQLPKVNEKRKRIVVITQGADPIIVADGDNIIEINVPQLNDEQIVDTNGAGDAFVGGFLSQLIQKKPIKECVEKGISTAQTVVQQIGCTFPNF